MARSLEIAAVQGMSIRSVALAVSNGLDRITRSLLAGLTVGLVIIVFLQVVFRYFLAIAFPASEELATNLFIWLTFLGAAVGIKQRSHPAIAFLVDRMPHSVRNTVEVFGLSATAWLLGFFVIGGINSTMVVASQTTPIMEISMAWVYLALPISGGLMLIHVVTNRVEQAGLSSRDLLVIAISLGVIWAMVEFVHVTSNIYLFLTVALIVLLLARMPVSIVLGLVTLLALMVNGRPVVQLVNRMIGGLNNFPLLAVPFFMLTGAVMATGTMAQRLTDFANALVGWIRGGLALADIVVSVIFADISGSAVADTAAIGSVMLPSMIGRGYDKDFATALQASAGSLGMQFPPSITMILYAWVASESVAALFAASFLPGLLVALSFGLVAYVVARRRGYPKEHGISLRNILRTFRRSFFALLAPVVIIGGILGGIMTPTEAGVVAAIYSVVVTVMLYGDVKIRRLPSVMAEAGVGVARVTFLVSTAMALSWVLIVNQGPQHLASLIYRFSQNPLVDILLINLLIMVVHTVLEPAATMLVLVPVLMPLLHQLAIDPVFFGIMFVMNSAIGFLLPPVGFCLYIACGVSGASLESVTRAILPFVIAITLDLLLVILYPPVVLWLPHLLHLH